LARSTAVTVRQSFQVSFILRINAQQGLGVTAGVRHDPTDTTVSFGRAARAGHVKRMRRASTSFGSVGGIRPRFSLVE
jgi:hypothetical protein